MKPFKIEKLEMGSKHNALTGSVMDALAEILGQHEEVVGVAVVLVCRDGSCITACEATTQELSDVINKACPGIAQSVDDALMRVFQ